MTPEWDLDTLCRRAADALGQDAGPGDARVRARPDARTVRYYTTLGLIDRPELHGRSGRYGRHHLLQLVAIKRLQAEGASLAEVQSRLLGLDETRLATIARVPTDGADASPSAPAPRGPFWTVRPEPEPADAAGEPASPEPETGHTGAAALALAPGALLVLADATLSATDADALRAAAGPLLAALRSRGLLATATGRPGKDTP